MSMIHEITSLAGAHKRRKRVGRGESSGLGKSSGRGNKGAQARAGGGVRRLTEGGQMPLFRRLPKIGFSNFNFRTEYDVVNLDTLGKHFAAGDSVTPDSLRDKRLVQRTGAVIKILGRGELPHKLNFEVHAVSATARAAIEKVGGGIKLIESKDRAALAKAKRMSAKKRRAAEGEKSTSERKDRKRSSPAAP